MRKHDTVRPERTVNLGDACPGCIRILGFHAGEMNRESRTDGHYWAHCTRGTLRVHGDQRDRETRRPT